MTASSSNSNNAEETIYLVDQLRNLFFNATITNNQLYVIVIIINLFSMKYMAIFD